MGMSMMFQVIDGPTALGVPTIPCVFRPTRLFRGVVTSGAVQGWC